MESAAPRLKIKVQFLAGDDIALGPGKVELLEWVDRCGSISGAARAMGLSYRRAWMMIDATNRCFETPLVRMAHGGARGGGAVLTAEGKAAIAAYGALQAEVDKIAAKRSAGLLGTMRTPSKLP